MIDSIISSLSEPFTAEILFDHLDSIVFFIKCDQGKYQVVNNTFVQRCGFSSKSKIVGKTPTDVFGERLGESFQRQDADILSTGDPILSRLELHIYPDGSTGWCLTHKLPLKGKSRNIVGLVGVSQDLRIPQKESSLYQQVSEAVRFAEANLSNRPSIKELAKISGLSLYQFDRRMKLAFGLSSGQWLMQLRIDKAQRLLSQTETPVSNIAMEVGYADQSAFARQFRVATGLTPGQYRKSASANSPRFNRT